MFGRGGSPGVWLAAVAEPGEGPQPLSLFSGASPGCSREAVPEPFLLPSCNNLQSDAQGMAALLPWCKEKGPCNPLLSTALSS